MFKSSIFSLWNGQALSYKTTRYLVRMSMEGASWRFVDCIVVLQNQVEN